MRYKFVLGFLFLVLFSILVSAFVFAAQESDEFKAEVQTVVNDIYPTQTAKFLVMITNPTKQDDDFKLDFGLVPKWSFATDPSSYLSSVDVDAGESVSFPVLIKASGDGMTYGMQAFTLTIKSVKTGLSKEYPLQLLLRNPTPPLKDYLPAVSITIDFLNKIGRAHV